MKSRGNFLYVAGLAVISWLLNRVIAQSATVEMNRSCLKIGVIVQGSNILSQYPDSFFKGIQLVLNQTGKHSVNKIRIVMKDINEGFFNLHQGRWNVSFQVTGYTHPYLFI